MPRITLRAPVGADALAIFEAVRDSMAELSPWMGWCSPSFSVDDAAAWIASCTEGRKRGESFQFTIRSDDDRLLGCCGLSHVNQTHRFANLGYWVRTADTGHGVATSGVRLLANWAFQNTELERLEIMCAVGNERSQRVAEAAGGQREGVLASRILVRGAFQDAVMYSIVRSSWLPTGEAPPTWPAQGTEPR